MKLSFEDILILIIIVGALLFLVLYPEIAVAIAIMGIVFWYLREKKKDEKQKQSIERKVS